MTAPQAVGRLSDTCDWSFLIGRHCRALTRQSIILCKKMDARVGPAHDGGGAVQFEREPLSARSRGLLPQRALAGEILLVRARGLRACIVLFPEQGLGFGEVTGAIGLHGRSCLARGNAHCRMVVRCRCRWWIDNGQTRIRRNRSSEASNKPASGRAPCIAFGTFRISLRFPGLSLQQCLRKEE